MGGGDCGEVMGAGKLGRIRACSGSSEEWKREMISAVRLACSMVSFFPFASHLSRKVWHAVGVGVVGTAESEGASRGVVGAGGELGESER